MKIHTKLICLCLLLLSSCYRTDSGLPGIDWNGNHLDKPFFSTRYNRESKAYYDKETPEQKALRKINRKICDEISLRSENRIPRAGYPNGVQNDINV